MNMPIDYTSPEIFYSLACFTFILAGIFSAVVRWCHMCHPFDKQGDYFYPARKQVTFFYAGVIVQLPYVFAPMDADAWFLVRSFGIVYYPVCFAMLFHRYFRLGRITRSWFSLLYFLIPFCILLLMLVLALCYPGDLWASHLRMWEYVIAIISFILFALFLREGLWLNGKIDEFHAQNFSNESDFPYLFAKKVIYMPVIWFVVMWGVFLSDSRMFKMVVDLVLACWMVYFLCQILHPNKMIHTVEVEENMDKIEQESIELVKKETEDFETNMQLSNPVEKDDQDALDNKAVNNEDWEAVKREVLTIVSKRYLEPSLKRVDVIRDVTFMKHTLAGNFITQVGFYKLVNAFRLRHYEKLVETPKGANMTQDAVAMLCGFKNRWALTNARKRMEDFDYSLIEDYVS